MPKVKKHKLVLIIVIIILLVSSLTLFKYLNSNKYTKVNKTFENSLLIENRISASKTSNIEIDAKIFQKELLKDFTRRKEIVGTIIIDNKKYELRGSKWGKATNNVFWGDVRESESSPNYKYIFFLSDDLNSIFLDSPKDSLYIVAPAKTIDEALSLKEKLLDKK